MWILIVLFVLLFLLLLLSMPLIVEANARVGLRGAIVRAKIYLLGLIPIPVKLRLRLFAPPYFTLQFGKKRIFLFQKKRRGKLIPDGVRILRLAAKTTVGIEGEPAAAVLTGGAISVLLAMLIPRTAESGSVRAALCERSMLRFTVHAEAIAEPAKLLFGILRNRRIERRKAVNTTGKIHEKRIKYASG